MHLAVAAPADGAIVGVLYMTVRPATSRRCCRPCNIGERPAGMDLHSTQQGQMRYCCPSTWWRIVFQHGPSLQPQSSLPFPFASPILNINSSSLWATTSMIRRGKFCAKQESLVFWGLLYVFLVGLKILLCFTCGPRIPLTISLRGSVFFHLPNYSLC